MVVCGAIGDPGGYIDGHPLWDACVCEVGVVHGVIH